jgi:antitoxin component HigA of HigAB toxin-antitoxin module
MIEMPGKKLVNAAPEHARIRSESELERATTELCGLLSLGRAFTAEEEERFQTLATAIEEYESANHGIPEPSQASILEHLLEAQGSDVEGLASATGIPRRTIDAILSGKKRIALKDAAKLARYFHVEFSVFQSPKRIGPQ